MIKLFCFPYAGGSATIYYKWKKFCKEEIELKPVELAGRGTRFGEKLYDNFDEMLEDAYNCIIRLLMPREKYALFGHSMGSILVFALAIKMMKNDYLLPECLFLSGSCLPDKNTDEKLFLLNDEDFMKEILKKGATDKMIFLNDDLRKTFLPILRADYRAIYTYKTSNLEKIDCDLVILNGKDDKVLLDNQLDEWNKFTTRLCNNYLFEGTHFYIFDHYEAVVDIINEKLAEKM